MVTGTLGRMRAVIRAIPSSMASVEHVITSLGRTAPESSMS